MSTGQTSVPAFTVNVDANGEFSINSQIPINFTGSDLVFRCAAWHSTIADPIGNQIDPTLAATVADVFEVFVPNTQPIIDFDLGSPNALNSLNGNQYSVSVPGNSTGVILVLEYNGLTLPNETNNLVDISYADNISGSYTYTSGTPSWFTASSVQLSQIGNPGANTYQVSLQLQANGTGNARNLLLKYIHSENNSFQEHILVTQQSSL